MRRLVHWAYRMQRLMRRVATFVYYLPLMVRVGSLSIWQREGSRAQAIRKCEQKRLRRPFDPVPYLFLVGLHVEDANHGKVADLCEDLELLGYFTAALAKKHAFALCHLERHRQAIDVLEQASGLESPDSWVLECLGNCYFTVAEYLLARQVYQRCLELVIAAEVRTRVEDWIRQIDVLLGYREGED